MKLPSYLHYAVIAGFGYLSAVSALGQSLPFVHQLFSNDMVLQRNASDPVWGWTTPGAQVQVVINGQTVSATADAQGRWQVNVGPFPAGGPYTMQITGPQSVTFTDILFGDVFLCSGQSNMNLSVSYAYNGSAEIADSANYPNIHCYTVRDVAAATPQTNLNSNGSVWQVAGPNTTGNFSAVAYFTARETYKQQGVPIGILVSSWGATEIQAWVNIATASSLGDFTQQIFDQGAMTPLPSGISQIYNGLIAPLAPFSIKAVEWYQGEFNGGQGQMYSRLLPSLFSGWRTLFGQPNLPFIVIQLPNNNPAQTQPVQTTPDWSEIREAQTNTILADAGRSRVVMTLDIGEGQLHPMNKQDVGLRASWAVSNLVYGSNIVNEGPICTGETVSGSTMTCTFSNTGGGLMVGTKNPQTPLSPVTQVVGGTLNGFALAGSDHVFYYANATITSPTTVAVSSPNVTNPIYVRYGWADNPVCNLYNEIMSGSAIVNGIPAGSFRNDPVYKLNTNNVNGSLTSYTIPVQGTVSASAQTGEAFSSWQGDTSALSGSGSSVTATLSQIYVSLFANYQITGAPAISVSVQVGQNIVSWSPLKSAHYNVKRGTSANGPFTTIASNLLNTTIYADTNIQGGTTYYYTVSAISPVNEGPNATPVAATSIAAVAGLTVTAGSAQVGLTWNALSSALSYNVARSTTVNGPYQTIARGITGTSYTDTAVVSGNTYYYVVSATTANGDTPVPPGIAGTPDFLPVPLQSQDIGSVGIPGSASMNTTGSFTVQASGTDTAGTSDQSRFTYVPITGNCTITAHVASLQASNGFAKAGVMLRATLDQASPFAAAFFYGDQTQSLNEFRFTSGDEIISTSTVGTGAYQWLRVVRSGSVFTTYTSLNGTTWTAMGTPETITMPSTIYAGLDVDAHDNTHLDTAVFDNVSGLSLQSPIAPASLTATTRTSDGNVTLSWHASAGALGYNVKMATTSGGPYTTVAANINAINYAPMGLTSGSTYYYVVSAVTGLGESANSSQVTVTLPTLSGATPVPLGLSAIPSKGQVSLSWSGSAIATSYNIKRSTTNGGPYATLASLATNSYVDTGLTNGTNYYYVVSAVAPAGESANSNQVLTSPVNPAQTGAIQAVNGLYATAAGSNPIIASSVSIGSPQIFDLITPGDGTTVIRSWGTGNYVVPPNAGASSLTATDPIIDSTDHYIFTWTNNTFNMEATVNDLYVTAQGGGSQPLLASRTSAGPWETFTFVPESVPVDPQNVSAIANNAQVVLTWGVVPQATSYNIKRATTSGGPYTQIGTTTTNSFTDTSMILGSTSYYVITAVNSLGETVMSSEVSATPSVSNVILNRTGWVASASVTGGGSLPANVLDGNLTTRWTTGASQTNGQWFQVDMGSMQSFFQIILASPNSSGDYPAGYQVNVSADGVNWGSPVASGTGTQGVSSMTITFAVQAARYIRITQTTTGVRSGWWSIDEFNVYGSSILIPPTPTGLTTTASPGQMALSWTASFGATSYNVKRSTTNGGPYTTRGNVTGTSYTDTGLANGTTYYYVVTALNSSGESASSSQASGLPGALPSPWISSGIGSVGLAGNAYYVSPQFTVTGSGVDIGSSADAFQYVYQTSSGDCSMVAQVLTVQNTNAAAKGGVMIRETTAAGAINAAVVVTPGNGLVFQWRTSTGGTTTSTTQSGLTAPYWVKLTRVGNAFTGYYSSNGTTWTNIGSTQTFTMATSATIGMAVTSDNNSALCTATFNNVTATP